MVFYIFTIPMFSFFFPLYPPWHMDNLFWTATRVVLGVAGKMTVVYVGHLFSLCAEGDPIS